MDIRSKPSTAENPTRLHSPALSAAVESFRALDHAKEAMTARMSGGVSPASLRAALADWLIHLAAAPGKQLEVTALGAQNAQRITEYLLRTALGWYAPPLAAGSAADSRFLAEPWQTEPYRFWQQTFLLTEQWWNAATRDVPGVTRHHEVVVSFIARQLLDMLAPTNFPLTNRSTARSNRKRNSMSRRLPARRPYGRERRRAHSERCIERGRTVRNDRDSGGA